MKITICSTLVSALFLGSLSDVTNVSKRAGVMLRGLWLTEVQLDNMLKELVD
ncbi:hypothetical protein H8E77_36800 [bacterium]|nr:hypothetical protein [bacterium]